MEDDIEVFGKKCRYDPPRMLQAGLEEKENDGSDERPTLSKKKRGAESARKNTTLDGEQIGSRASGPQIRLRATTVHRQQRQRIDGQIT
jgi:hypothetical protein